MIYDSIDLMISESTTKEEWQSVYEESLKLVDAFSLAEEERAWIDGIVVTCMVPTEEREKIIWGLTKEIERVGWTAEANYDDMEVEGKFYLPRDLVKDNAYNPDAGDAIWGVLPSLVSYTYGKDSRCEKNYEVYCGPIFRRNYLLSLLAVACMIESRLGKKAFVSGEFAPWAYQEAVALANKYLKVPVTMPARCDKKRFFDRVKQMPLSEQEQLKIFQKLYIGPQDTSFGTFVRANFSTAAYMKYWRDIFEYVGEYKDKEIREREFEEKIKNYLSCGFETEQLCELISFTGKEEINKAIEKVTMDEIRRQETSNQDDSDQNDSINISLDAVREIADLWGLELENDGMYDIPTVKKLKFYNTGDTMPDYLKKLLVEAHTYYSQWKEDTTYKALMKETPEERCKWLAKQKDSIFFLREKDWKQIFSEIKQKPNAFKRYYSMMNIDVSNQKIYDLVVALLINEALFQYSERLAFEEGFEEGRAEAERERDISYTMDLIKNGIEEDTIKKISELEDVKLDLIFKAFYINPNLTKEEAYEIAFGDEPQEESYASNL